MRKGRDREKRGGKKEKKKKRRMKIVATTSLPAVDRPNANRWNAARSCQLVLTEKLSHPPLVFATCFHGSWGQ